MTKRIIFCDICGREIHEEHKDKNPYTYSLYKNINGLWTEQDLCSLCYMKLVTALEEGRNG